MKKYIWIALCVGIALGVSGILRAENPGLGNVTFQAKRLPNNYATQTVYQASQTCAGSALQSVWISSPYVANLYMISVTSAGTADSLIDVFDGVGSTSNSRLIARIDGRTNRDFLFNVAFSSWLGVSNQATNGTPACISIFYRVR